MQYYVAYCTNLTYVKNWISKVYIFKIHIMSLKSIYIFGDIHILKKLYYVRILAVHIRYKSDLMLPSNHCLAATKAGHMSL